MTDSISTHQDVSNPSDLSKLDRDQLIAFLLSHRDDRITLWNTWRKARKQATLDLSGADLSRSNLEAINLALVELKEVNLAQAQLAGCGFFMNHAERSNFSHAHMQNAGLVNSNFLKVNFRGAVLREASILETILREAVFEMADLTQVQISDADMEKANLKRVEISGARIEKSNLRMANLTFANLQGSAITKTNLTSARLEGANLKGADLTETDLSGSNLKNAVLDGATVIGASLNGTDLRLAHLRDVALSPLRLDGLRGVRLYQTYFWGVLSLRYEQLLDEAGQSSIWEDQQGRYSEAKDIYKSLKGYFEDAGDYQGANWAYSHEKQMEKLMRVPAWARRLYPKRVWVPSQEDGEVGSIFWKPNLLEWLRLELSDKLAGYGLSLGKPLVWLGITILSFTVIYWLFGMITATPGCSYADGMPPALPECAPTRNPFHALLFSFGSLTNIQIGPLRPYLSHVGILMTIEVLLGIALTGLFGFVLGNKLRNS